MGGGLRDAGVKPLSPADLEAYAALGLEPKPFENFRIFAPFKPGQAPGGKGDLDVQLDRHVGSLPGKLNTDRDIPAHSHGVVFPVLWQLEPLLWMPHKVFDFADLDDKLSGFIYELRDSRHRLDEPARQTVRGDRARTSRQTERRQLERSPQSSRSRRRATGSRVSLTNSAACSLAAWSTTATCPPSTSPFVDQELRVVDIADCNSDVQEILVTKVIEKIWKMAEQQKLGVETVVIFVDELNKYAPAGGQGGLRDTLVDIAARGRHLNVVLFGAEQFRSKVDERDSRQLRHLVLRPGRR